MFETFKTPKYTRFYKMNEQQSVYDNVLQGYCVN